MKKFIPLLIIVALAFAACSKHHSTEILTQPDLPEKAHFTSMFRDTTDAIVSGASYGSDFARSEIKDTVFSGATYLKIRVRQRVDWGSFENVEMLIKRSQLTADWKGKYKINFDGSTSEPATLKHNYNTNDTVYPVTLYSSGQLKGEGYVEITGYNKEKKLVTGTFHSYASDVPNPFYGLLGAHAHWDATLDGEFTSIKIQ